MKKAELDNRFPLFYFPPLLIPAHLSPPASCPQHSPARHKKNPAGTIRVPNGINFAPQSVIFLTVYQQTSRCKACNA